MLLSRTGLEFAEDPRLPTETQVGNELYARNSLDRGHLARRSHLIWGCGRGATGQPRLQSSQEGIWGRLEDALYEDVDVQDLRASVFAGPVSRRDDRVYRGVALPSEYWKLLVFQEQGVVKARAFLLTQDLDHLRAVLALDEFRVYQVSVGELQARTQLRFPAVVQEAGTFPVDRAADRKPLAVAADIAW